MTTTQARHSGDVRPAPVDLDKLDTADVVGSVRFPDPFRWLEESSARTLTWQDDMQEAAAERLHSHPAYQVMVDAAERHMSAFAVSAPRRYGDDWFGVDGEGRLVRGACSDDLSTVLFDARDVHRGVASAALDSWFVSPDVEYVVVGSTTENDEQTTLQVIDRDGRPLGSPMRFASGSRVEWLPDASGFWYAAGSQRDTDGMDKSLYFRSVADGRVGEPVREELPHFFYDVNPQLSRDGRWLLAISNSINPVPTHARLLPDGEWTEMVPDNAWDADEPYFVHGAVYGDSYLAITTAGSPRGRIVSVPLGQATTPADWTELMPEDAWVLRNLSAFDHHTLILTAFREGQIELHLLDTSGTLLRQLPVPPDGVINTFAGFSFSLVTTPPYERDDTGISFVHSDLGRSPVPFRLDIPSGDLHQLGSSAVVIEGLETWEDVAIAADGTPVRLLVAELAPSRRGRPTLVVAYGGWNVVSTFNVYLGIYAPLVEAGVRVVFAHVRGESTFGADRWWHARRHHGHVTVNDLRSVVEHLQKNGYCTPQTTAIAGSSNGGLLVAAATVQFPHLLGGVVCQVPILDLARFTRDDRTARMTSEYCDPRIERDAAFNLSLSPIHNVRAGVDYPPVLFQAGSHDVRCDPWHARKMAAHLADAQGDASKVYLRVYPDSGHATGAVLARPERVAEFLTFTLACIAGEALLETAGEERP